MIEIRDAGAMGLGVFATVAIPQNQWLGEYIGEIRPTNAPIDLNDPYTFVLGNDSPVCIITSRDFGNWTRFINHACIPNVDVVDGMYGHRRAIVFRTTRAIAANEQLSIDYGPNYFSGFNMLCQCNSYNGPPHNHGGAVPPPAARKTGLFAPLGG
ncbi:hypothetical protein Daus18300_010116 [Diaporthe australafricana]|uniref:SET domain-containing protein n=1 Tax=Diaporthe australafricana TaxID=127596 RepID=A0ABR3WBP1_9PEZI